MPGHLLLANAPAKSRNVSECINIKDPYPHDHLKGELIQSYNLDTYYKN